MEMSSWRTTQQCLHSFFFDVFICGRIYEYEYGHFSSSSRLFQVTKLLGKIHKLISKELWPSGYNLNFRSGGFWVQYPELARDASFFFFFPDLCFGFNACTQAQKFEDMMEGIQCLIQTPQKMHQHFFQSIHQHSMGFMFASQVFRKLVLVPF